MRMHIFHLIAWTRAYVIGCCLAVFIFLVACGGGQRPSLPILGERQVLRTSVGVDTVYHTIPDFTLTDQDSAVFTFADLHNKVYVADFFFARCPTICPVMARELLRVQAAYPKEDRLHIVSHSVDPLRDTPSVLRSYADRLSINTDQWAFLTGNPDSIYTLARTYLAVAMPDSTAPGGFMHSASLLLVDTQRRIRGVYDGTVSEEVDRLIQDITVLLEEPSDS